MAKFGSQQEAVKKSDVAEAIRSICLDDKLEQFTRDDVYNKVNKEFRKRNLGSPKRRSIAGQISKLSKNRKVGLGRLPAKWSMSDFPEIFSDQ